MPCLRRGAGQIAARLRAVAGRSVQASDEERCYVRALVCGPSAATQLLVAELHGKLLAFEKCLESRAALRGIPPVPDV